MRVEKKRRQVSLLGFGQETEMMFSVSNVEDISKEVCVQGINFTYSFVKFKIHIICVSGDFA